MKELGIEFRYEPETLEYRKRVVKGVCDACGGNKTSQKRTYRPDFVLRLSGGPESGMGGAKVFIETKGNFSPSDRAKMVAVKQDHPDLDIRLIFGADNKLKKNNEKRYSDWCREHKFPYYIGKKFPPEWASGLPINSDSGPVRQATKRRRKGKQA